MTTGTARKTSLENKHLRNCDYFASIPSVRILQCWRRTLQLDWSERCSSKSHNWDIRLYAQVVVKTVNAVISRGCFPEDGTDLFIGACRTCSTIVFPHSTNQILNLWRCRSCSRRWCLNSLLGSLRNDSCMIWLVEWGKIMVLHVRQAFWCNFFGASLTRYRILPATSSPWSFRNAGISSLL